MNARRVITVGGLVLGLFLVTAQPAEAQIRAHGAFTKLGRGFVNVVTGWVEIPKRIYETSYSDGPWLGFTWGTIRGIGFGLLRTTAGFYDLLTFPYPAPENYEPVFVPEFVFLEEEADWTK